MTDVETRREPTLAPEHEQSRLRGLRAQALVIAALANSAGLSPTPDTGALRDDLLAFQRQQVRMMDTPESRRITAGLVADLVANPELAETYLAEYIGPRQRSVWQALQRGVDFAE